MLVLNVGLNCSFRRNVDDGWCSLGKVCPKQETNVQGFFGIANVIVRVYLELFNEIRMRLEPV